METTWLQEEKLRAFPSAPVSREIFLTKWPGIRLQICLRTVNLLRVGFLFFDFIPAEWQVSKQITSPFCFQPMGWLWEIYESCLPTKS